MLRVNEIRISVLVVHGITALTLGILFFLLHGIMTDVFFDAIAAGIAIMLAAAALILTAAVDWIAAFTQGIKNIHRFIFSLLAGSALTLAGLFLALSPIVHTQWLVIFAAVHALVFGVSLLVSAEPLLRRSEQYGMYLMGVAFIVFSGILAGWVRSLNDRSALVLLGWYLSLVGVRMLIFAWHLHRENTLAKDLLATVYR